MKQFVFAAGIVALAACGSVMPIGVDDHPIVIDFLTSQACSSCLPADAFLHELACRDDVIALTLHADYRNYICWKDKFTNPEFS